jgi:hypothetical protein
MGWTNFASLGAIIAGATYFLIVFSCAFVLGTIRYLAVSPSLGEFTAVLIELPIIIMISWVACGSLIRRFRVPNRFPHRLVMSGLAFSLLMASEGALSTLAFGRSLSDFFAGMATLPGAFGLAGQIAFAVFPMKGLPIRECPREAAVGPMRELGAAAPTDWFRRKKRSAGGSPSNWC